MAVCRPAEQLQEDAVRGSGGDRHRDRRANSMRGLDFHGPPELLRPAAHPRKAVAGALPARAEPRPVVGDDEAQPLRDEAVLFAPVLAPG